jgi:hypothetical protein
LFMLDEPEIVTPLKHFHLNSEILN